MKDEVLLLFRKNFKMDSLQTYYNFRNVLVNLVYFNIIYIKIGKNTYLYLHLLNFLYNYFQLILPFQN